MAITGSTHMNTNELIQRGLYYIADAWALPNLKDNDRIVAVNEFGEQVIGPYDTLSFTVPGLRGRVVYWRHAVAADERAARR
jgi:hypothetical protein